MINLKIISIYDKEYPKTLKEIKNPPQKLYAEGNLELLNTKIISIVGSRACTRTGEKLAEKFSKELSYQGLTIASGMAIGIDTIAHKTAIESNGKTIAVLGSGLNQIYPKENTELYQQIIQNCGLVLTEYPPEEKACSNNFLERNRIVSGIAIGILVIESAYRSGTSVTAKLAKQQNRKVFALPHEIGNSHGVGTNKLIQGGAKLVTNTKDIIDEFPFIQYKQMPKYDYKNENENENENEKSKKIEIQKKKCTNVKYNEIYQYITEQPITLNEICQKTNKNISEINNILLMLELEGYIEKTIGGYICILDKK